MSVGYVGVQWNKRKLVYDAALVVGVAAYVVLFRWLGARVGLSQQILAMRAWGSCAFVMLTLILTIGPLARLDRRFLPLLYNRRHFGVLMCLVGLAHAREVLGYYYDYGQPRPPRVALFAYDVSWTSASLPFPLFGAAALAIIVVMAATSHDFWQRLLGGALWKWLHMGVYVAYTLVVLHVAFGAVVSEAALLPVALALGSVALVVGLHLAAARASASRARAPRSITHEDDAEWIDAGLARDLPLDRARPLPTPTGERIALVRTKDGVSAVHGVCAHQGGPLSEARVIDGCLTCPWHGWQYRPGDGCSPPPFQEKLPTYRVRTKDGRVLVDPRPLAPGTAVPPAPIDDDEVRA